MSFVLRPEERRRAPQRGSSILLLGGLLLGASVTSAANPVLQEEVYPGAPGCTAASGGILVSKNILQNIRVRVRITATFTNSAPGPANCGIGMSCSTTLCRCTVDTTADISPNTSHSPFCNLPTCAGCLGGCLNDPNECFFDWFCTNASNVAFEWLAYSSDGATWVNLATPKVLSYQVFNECS